MVSWFRFGTNQVDRTSLICLSEGEFEEIIVMYGERTLHKVVRLDTPPQKTPAKNEDDEASDAARSSLHTTPLAAPGAQR